MRREREKKKYAESLESEFTSLDLSSDHASDGLLEDHARGALVERAASRLRQAALV